MKRKYIATAVILSLALTTACGKSQNKTTNESMSGTSSNENAETVSEDGSSQENEANESQVDVERGRYVEHSIQIPEEMASAPEQRGVLGMTIDSSDQCILYGMDSENSKVNRYRLQEEEDYSWEKEELGWTEGLIDGELYGVQMFATEEGNEYLYVSTKTEGIYIPHLYTEKDGQATEVSMEGWGEFDEATVPENVQMTADGKLLAIQNGNLNCYDVESGELLSSVDTNNRYLFNMVGQSFAHTEWNADTSMLDIEVYDSYCLDTEPVIYECEEVQAEFIEMCGNSKGNIICLGECGLVEIGAESKTASCLLEKEKTALYSPDCWIYNVKADSKDNYYALAQCGDYEILKYEYDADAPVSAQYHLDIYSLRENPVIKMAIVDYQEEHPECEFTYDYSFGEYDEEEGVDTDEYIRVLNTQILAGEGPDIIDLTGLPTEDFMEKGALAEITDVVEELMQNGEVIDSVVEQSAMDGKYYSLPMGIAPICILGEERTSQCQSLSDFVDCAKEYQKDGSSIFGQVSVSGLVAMFTPIECSNFVDDQGNLSEESLQSFVENIKLLYELSGGSEDGRRGNSLFGLVGGNQCYLDEILSRGYLGMWNDVYEYTGYETSSVDYYYTPLNEVAINVNCEQIQVAKEFYSYLYTEGFQEKLETYEFPSNPKALKAVLQPEEVEYAEDSGWNIRVTEDETVFLPNVNLSEKVLDQFFSICTNVKQVYQVDEDLNEMITESILGYVTGEESLESAMSELVSKVRIILAE